jgi:hypothetical protein
MDDDVIKWLIHHSDSSDVMRTTYKHLSSEDWIQKAEASAGFKEPEEQSSLTPMSCDVCGHSLGPNDVACSNCGNVFSPEAHSTKQEIEQDMKDSYREVEPGDSETIEKVDQLDELLDDPDVKAALLEKLAEE